MQANLIRVFGLGLMGIVLTHGIVSAQGKTARDTVSGAYRGGNGSSGSATLGQNAGQARYSNGQGTTLLSSYRNGNVQANGTYRGSDGSSGSGSIRGNSGNFNYQNGGGTSYGGNYQRNGGGNYQVNGNYQTPTNSYSGGVQRQNGQTTVNGEVRKPGYVPYTQDRINGQATIAGRNSTVQGTYGVYDSTGRVQLGQGQGSLNRTQVQGGYQSNGPVRYSTLGQANFNGTNTRLSQVTGYQANGVGGASYNYGVSRRGVDAGAQANVAGSRVGANATVDNRGLNVNVGGNLGGNRSNTNIQVNAPKIPTTVSTPRVSTSSVPTTSQVFGGL